MKKSHILASSILFLGLVSSLLSCQGGGSSTTSSSGDSASSVSDDTITIPFWETNGADLLAAFKTAATHFAALVQEHDGVKVNVVPSYQGNYDDLETKITKGFATGDVPTLAVAYPDAVADFLAADVQNRGYVVNLADYIDDPSIGFGKESWFGDGPVDDLIPAFYQEGTQYSKEGVYSLPFMKSSEVMFYNYGKAAAYGKNYIPQGASTPLATAASVKAFIENMSWDQLIDFATYIKAQDTANSLVAPIFYDSDSNLFITQSKQKDIPYLSITSEGKCSVDFVNDSAKTMVAELKAAHDAGLLETKGTKNVYGSNLFITQQIIFSIGSSGGTDYQDPADAFVANAVKVPYANGKPTYVSQGPTLCVLRNTGLSDAENAKRVEYAWKFIKYLTSTDLNTALCVNNSAGYTPVRKSCYTTEGYQTFLEETADQLSGKAASVVVNQLSDKYFNTPAVKGSSKARDEVGGIITQVLLGKKSVDDAFASAYQQTTLNT